MVNINNIKYGDIVFLKRDIDIIAYEVIGVLIRTKEVCIRLPVSDKKSRNEWVEVSAIEVHVPTPKNTTISTERVETGLKFDSDKPDYTLVNKELMEAVAKGMTVGVKKYGRLNYRKFTKADIPRFEAALLRHMFSHLSGEEIDADTGLPHLYLVGTNLNIILWLKENGK